MIDHLSALLPIFADINNEGTLDSVVLLHALVHVADRRLHAER